MAKYGYLSRIIGDQWYRLTHQIDIAGNPDIIDCSGLDNGLSVRGKTVIVSGFSRCANELCSICEDIPLLSEALRTELPSFLLDELERNEAMAEIEVRTARHAVVMAKKASLLPLRKFPPTKLKISRESRDSREVSAQELAHDLIWLRAMALKKVQLVGLLRARKLSMQDVKFVSAGEYEIEEAAFLFDLAAIESIDRTHVEFLAHLDKTSSDITEKYENNQKITGTITKRRTAWLKRHHTAVPVEQEKNVAELLPRAVKLSSRDARVHDIVGKDNFLTLTNAEICRFRPIKQRFHEIWKVPSIDAERRSLDRIRKAKGYPSSRQIKKKRALP